MTRKQVTISIDEDVYKAYKDYCEKNCLKLSRKIESLMKEELIKSGWLNEQVK